MTLRKRTPTAPLEPPLSGTRPDRGVSSEENVVARVRSEFQEMRGFSPTLTQAARLFHLRVDECEHLLNELVRDRFLQCGPDGTYRLAGE